MQEAEKTPINRGGRPTAEDAREKMARILTVARAQFVLLGYRAVTMRHVAEKAGVSTRTLYDNHGDKLSLFRACLDSNAGTFPRIDYRPEDDVAEALRHYAAAVVRLISTDASQRIAMLAYNEGGEFPELIRATEAHQEIYMVEPLAKYLRDAGLGEGEEYEHAKMFIALAISEWQRRMSFLRPLPDDGEIERHAERAARLFLAGACGRRQD